MSDTRARGLAYAILFLSAAVVVLIPWTVWRIATRRTHSARIDALERRVESLERGR